MVAIEAESQNCDLKTLFRRRILQERKLLDHDKSERLSNKVCNNVRLLLNSIDPDFLHNIGHHDHNIGLYWTLHGEPDLFRIVLSANYLGLPKLTQNNMSFVKYKHGDPVEESHITSLYQPQAHYNLDPDILIIPALALSVNGYRLGFGKGYYDQYLSRVSKKNKQNDHRID